MQFYHVKLTQVCARKTWATWSWSSTKRPRRRRDTGDMERQRNSADSCEHVVNMCENMWNILKCCINICICHHLCCVAAMDLRVYLSRQNVGILSCACMKFKMHDCMCQTWARGSCFAGARNHDQNGLVSYGQLLTTCQQLLNVTCILHVCVLYIILYTSILIYI